MTEYLQWDAGKIDDIFNSTAMRSGNYFSLFAYAINGFHSLASLFRAAIESRITWSVRLGYVTENALTEKAWEDPVQGLGKVGITYRLHLS